MTILNQWRNYVVNSRHQIWQKYQAPSSFAEMKLEIKNLCKCLSIDIVGIVLESKVTQSINLHFLEDTDYDIHNSLSKLIYSNVSESIFHLLIKERSTLPCHTQILLLMSTVKDTCKTNKYLSSRFTNANINILIVFTHMSNVLYSLVALPVFFYFK